MKKRNVISCYSDVKSCILGNRTLYQTVCREMQEIDADKLVNQNMIQEKMYVREFF